MDKSILDQVDMLLENNQIEEAEKLLIKILNSTPDFIGYNKLGLIYAKIQENERAKEYFEKALELNPNYYNALNNLGNLARQSGKLKEAANYYERAAEIAPDVCGIHKNLAVVYKQQFRFTDYKREIDHVKKLGGDSSPLTAFKELVVDIIKLIKGSRG